MDGSSKTFGWLDVHRIGEELFDAHPDTDPLTLRFTELRQLVGRLPNFTPDPGHPVNERILESIQMIWNDERSGVQRDE
jgi:FeS assembly protein IscX